MLPERRFQGAMSLDYQLVRLAIPHFEEVQRQVAEAVAAHVPADGSTSLRVLELGCGDGMTSASILARRPDVILTALNNEPGMIGHATERLRGPLQEGRCQVVHADALVYLRAQPPASVDVVASALALHNSHRVYRHGVHEAIHRVLLPGGLFVNGDKFALDDTQRFAGLHVSLERFFDLLVPLGKLDLLRDCVLHNVADESPERVMREHEVVQELSSIGFQDVTIRCRYEVAAVLVATRSNVSSPRDV
jgi:SAM-dependent methyltransferase